MNLHMGFLCVLVSFPNFKGRQTGVFQTGGIPDLDLSFLFCPFLSFLGLSRFFRAFPDLLGDGPGIFPISPFPLSRPIKGTYEEQSRKAPRHNLDLSQKKWETPGFGNPNQFSFSQKSAKNQQKNSAKFGETSG